MIEEEVEQHQWGRFGGKDRPERRSGVDRRKNPRPPQPPPRREGRGGFLLSLLLVAGVVGGAVYGALLLRKPQPDPHYVSAVKLIETYEQGKAPERRNYGHRVYQTSLQELGQVDPESISAEDAIRLEREINDHIAAFREGLRAQAQAQEEAMQARQERREIEYQQRVWARAHVQTYYPECESGGHDHEGHTHKH